MTYMPSGWFPRGARPIARPIYRFPGCPGCCCCCCCLLRCFSRVSRPSQQHRCPPIHRLWVHRESRCQATRTVASSWHASHPPPSSSILPFSSHSAVWTDGSLDQGMVMGRAGAALGVDALSWNGLGFLACDRDVFLVSFLDRWRIVERRSLEWMMEGR